MREDELEVIGGFNDEDELLISINPQEENSHVYLAREDVKQLVKHLSHLLEEN